MLLRDVGAILMRDQGPGPGLPFRTIGSGILNVAVVRYYPRRGRVAVYNEAMD